MRRYQRPLPTPHAKRVFLGVPPDPRPFNELRTGDGGNLPLESPTDRDKLRSGAGASPLWTPQS